jgi:hypothetical protein
MFKGTVRPDWVCMRVISLESPLKGHQPLHVFKPWTEQARELDSILHEAGQYFELFKSERKKLKNYSGWCPFKGLSNDTTLMQIQSGRTVPLRRDYPALQKLKFINFFLCLWVIFALRDPDMDPGTPLNPDPYPQHWWKHLRWKSGLFTLLGSFLIETKFREKSTLYGSLLKTKFFF